jgi:hypothetical protein
MSPFPFFQTGCTAYAFVAFVAGMGNVYILASLSVLRCVKICSQAYRKTLLCMMIKAVEVWMHALFSFRRE